MCARRDLLPPRIAFGTMHGKAAAVAPPLLRLGVELVVPDAFDTDRFGTFSGEQPRAGTMIEAARAKARAAAMATGLPVGLASEGAYGPHPAVPVLPWGCEVLLWHETASGREIVETLIDDAPVWAEIVLSEASEAAAFLTSIGFPATAVVVAPAGGPAGPVAKGVTDPAVLDRAVTEARALSPEGRARVQVDMRAHVNPRRMEVIGRLAGRLAERLAAACPACRAPGWGRLRTEQGLPCGWCGTPTALAKAEVLGCTACGHEVARPLPDGPAEADPAMCPACNP